MRLVPRSLHGRLLALSLLATAVALALAGLAIGGVLERFVTQNLDQRLDAELSLLATAVDGDGRIDRARVAQVRGLLDPGRDWRWRIAGAGGTLGSADFPALDPGPPHGRFARGPRDRPGDRPRPAEGRWPDDHGRASGGVHARTLTLATARGPVVLTAAAPRGLIARPIRTALLPLLATLGMLGVLLAAASLIQLRLGLRPLRALGHAVAAIRTGRAASVPTDQPAELAPLAAELNALAADNAAALATARASAANLAHALKTPVATLALTLADQPAAAAQVARLDATIRHHLARARAGMSGTRVATPLAPLCADLVQTIARLHAERGLAITANIPADLGVAVDPHDLSELVGNLLDNAARHANTRIALTARAEARHVRLNIADDGPGIPAAARATATAPGARLDEAGDGHGFGLAIVRDLAALHGGALTLDDAPGGGLVASVTLPRAA